MNRIKRRRSQRTADATDKLSASSIIGSRSTNSSRSLAELTGSGLDALVVLMWAVVFYSISSANVNIERQPL